MIKLHQIVRAGNMVARVIDINENDKTVTLNSGAVISERDISCVLPEGTLLQNTTDGNVVMINDPIEVLEDTTMIGGTPFFKENGSPNFKIKSFPSSIKLTDKLYTELKEFFDTTSYTANERPLSAILGEWHRNKERLRKILSLSPYWKEDILALDWEIQVPDQQRRDEARGCFGEIMAHYYREFEIDYDHCVKYEFSNFFDITDNKIFKMANINIACGMKPSRAFRKYFEAIGAHRISDFEKLYAKLADALSDKPLKRRITLSIHPLDYCRMSYGISWDSCHHIGHGGCYSNGALSYLMDKCAMVCTLLSTTEKSEPAYQLPKINRMMFFLNESGDILQSRLYPQTRIPELEKILAEEVSAKIKEALKIEGEYEAIVEDTRCDNYVWSIGPHYHDYNCSNFGQNIWSVKDSSGIFTIGHPGICVTCGDHNARHNSLYCGCYKGNSEGKISQNFNYVCPNSGREFYNKGNSKLNPADGKYYLETYVCPVCGQIFFDKNELYCPDCRKDHHMTCDCGSEDIVLVFNGKAYCEKCAFDKLAYCERCGTLDYRRNLREYDEELLCDSCLDDYEELEVCEDCGTRFNREEEGRYIEGYGWVCDACYDDGDYFCCDDCGNYYRSNEGTWVGDDQVCESCLDRHYTYCDICEEYYPNNEINDVGDLSVCDDCLSEHFTRCDECGEYVRNDDIIRVGDDYVCPDCYDYYYAICEECGETYRKDEMHPFGDGYICDECYREHENAESAEEEEIQYGILRQNIDGRFREGQVVRICGETEDGSFFTIRLEDGNPEFFRFVEKSMVSCA